MVNIRHWLAGMEGYSMYLLTKYREPQSRGPGVVYVAQISKALKNPRIHAYQRTKRIWARTRYQMGSLVKVVLWIFISIFQKCIE